MDRRVRELRTMIASGDEAFSKIPSKDVDVRNACHCIQYHLHGSTRTKSRISRRKIGSLVVGCETTDGATPYACSGLLQTYAKEWYTVVNK